MSTQPTAIADLGGPEHEIRLAALRGRMADLCLSAAAFASPEHVYYLTGLDHLGYFAFTLLVIPATGDPVVVTRAMERPTVAAQIPHCRHVTFDEDEDPADAVAAVLSGLASPGCRIGVDDRSMFLPPAIRNRITAALPHVDWQDASALLSPAMAVKSVDEIAHVRRAAALSDLAMTAAITTAGPCVAEQAVVAEIHRAMLAAGGQQPGFPPLVRPLSLLDQEHVTWGERVLRAGDGLFVELSGCSRRYHAPLSRTIYIGQPPPGAEETHAVAVGGLLAAAHALRPGVPTGEVYAAWQRSVAGSETTVWPLRHHCGYLVGIGFPPSWVGGGEVLGIRHGGTTVVQPGMTFHLMSWVSGHVVSDTALVTQEGTQLLTAVTRELLVVG